MKRLIGIGAAIAALLFSAAAFAQCTGSPPANSICAGVASGSAGPVKLRQMVLPDLPQIPTGAVIGNNSGATGRPAALSATDLAGVLGIFSATNNGLVPAPQTQTSFTEPVFVPASNALGTAAVPSNLYEFYSVNADAVWRPKTGSFQYVSSGTAQIDPDAGLVLVNNASGAPISLGLPPEANVQPGWVIRVAVLAADATQTVTVAAAAGDAIQSQGADVNPVVITSPRSTQFTAAGSFPWAFANFGAPTSQFAGMVPPNNGAAGSYLDVNLQWTVPGGGGGPSVLPDIPDQTVIGNVSGAIAQPSALTQVQLQSLIGQFTAALPGLVPASGVGTPATDVLQANGVFAQIAAGSVSGLGPLATAPGVSVTAPLTGNGTSASPITMPSGMPAVQRFLSGSGTFAPQTVCATRVRVKMKAGGGGGQGARTAFVTADVGTAGQNSTFENWVAVGGAGGGTGGGGGGGDGTGTLIDRTPGAAAQIGGGWAGITGSIGIYGRSGGGSGSGLSGSGGADGGSAQPNSGGGGGGGGPAAGAAGFFGAGGSEGETVEFWIPPGTYNYSVGNGGAGAAAISGVQYSGGQGGSGKIVAEEYCN